MSKGELSNVYHFDSKAEIESYIRQLGIPSTFFLAGFYMSNLSGGMLRQDGDKYVLAFPTSDKAQVPLFDTVDTGKFVKGILLNRDETLGKRVLGATKYYTPTEIVNEFKEVTGKEAVFVTIDQKTFSAGMASTGAPDFVQLEMYENMRLLDTYGYYGGESLDWSHKVRPLVHLTGQG